MPQISVLVVDDSAFMRRAITSMIENEADIRVVATARSGEEAIAKSAELTPDVITMDVEMPGMGGLEAVRQIVAHRRVPIIMVSALTQEGAEITFRALDLGAVDFIAKPDAAYVNITDVSRDLIAKIRTLGARSITSSRIVPSPLPARTIPQAPRSTRRGGQRFACVAIGTSTGGPVALSQIVPRLPAEFSLPIVIVQHMPRGFTRPLAQRLNGLSRLEVAELEEGMALEAGRVLIVPSGRDVSFHRSGNVVEARLIDGTEASFHVPSVDVMMSAMASVYAEKTLAVILTGMGQDGVKGLRVVKDRGGFVIGQNEESCVVYGMPRAAAKEGLVDRVVALSEVPTAIRDLTNAVP